ncbi:MAG TPA: SLC13 family permease [Enhygromyxa sp.]|nr:SLC13 family permease [Enhygromyxa sp.]
MPVVGVLIFAVTYVLISARRLEALGFDRPAGALLGAVACVAFGVLAPEQALAAVDASTLLLLLGVMGMGAFLAVDGLFEQLEGKLIAIARTPARLLGLLIWGSGLLAAVITNDAVCVLGAPLVVRLIERHRLPPLPYLLALATAANTGSVATLVGNPQNMLCAQLGELGYREHLTLMAPVALAGLALNHGLLWAMFRAPLRAASLGSPDDVAISGRAQISLAIIVACSVAYTLGTDLAWTATGGFVILMLIHRRDTRELWPRIDWTLLLFFAGLFVVVEGLVQTGVPAAMFERWPLAAGEGPLGWLRLTGIFVIGSNVVSNVPFILVIREQLATLPDPRAGWELLAMASTFAGNLTLLGSVANIIIAEAGRDVGGLGFWQHLRVGLPLTLITTLVGAAWLWLVSYG